MKKKRLPDGCQRVDDLPQGDVSPYQVGVAVRRGAVCSQSMGEFGAVSVLSGHLRGRTNTLPLHVEILFNEFQYVPAFAASSILVLMAIVILVIRSLIEHRGGKRG